MALKILVASPIELPYTIGARYTGLERLAVQFAEQWQLLGHNVSLMAHKDTTVPTGVNLLSCDGYERIARPAHAEVAAFQRYQAKFYDYDIIWDIGHLHLPARFMPHLPTVNVFSANPQYEAINHNEKAPYNLISWSKWGINEIRKYYGRDSRYQETIMVDSELYKPKGKRGDRFLTIGRMSDEKGNLNAVMLCRKLGLPLDVAGGRGSETTASTPLTDYERHVMDLCDDQQIKFYGEVSDEQKVELMQTCKALIYVTNHIEITSHKVQEAMLCGVPVLVPNKGGLSEIVTHGVDGFLCTNEQEYIMGIQLLDKLDLSKTRESLIAKYSPKNVAEGYIKLFEKVKEGLRWR